MNFFSYKITEKDHDFFLYTISPFDGEDNDFVMEQIEHWVANSPQNQICQYLVHCDFDAMTIEKLGISPSDIINKNIPHDPKCLNVSTDYIPLIPPPKPKRTPKPKAEKPQKEPKPKGKKTQQNVETALNATN